MSSSFRTFWILHLEWTKNEQWIMRGLEWLKILKNRSVNCYILFPRKKKWPKLLFKNLPNSTYTKVQRGNLKLEREQKI